MKRLFCLLLTLALVVGLVPAARAEAALPQVLMGQTKALKPGSTSESIYAKISGVITAGGDLYVWGYNFWGQAGTAASETSQTPTKVLSNVKKAVLGYHCAAITESGDLYTWGYNYMYQLGNGKDASTPKPQLVLTDVVDVALGDFHTAALTADGAVYCWGANGNGQLGTGDNTSRSRPVRIMDGVKKVCAAGKRTMVLTEAGFVYGWGQNAWGQLGISDDEDRNEPVSINKKNVVELVINDNNTALLTESGTLYLCGNNTYRQITSSNVTEVEYLQDVATGVKAVALGSWHVVYLTENGDLYGRGRSSSGQCGTVKDTVGALRIAGQVASVTAGGNHTVYITEAGELYTLGSDSYGQLGDGPEATGQSAIPKKILSNAVQSAAFLNNTAAVTADGQVYFWGDDSKGQVGNGPTVGTAHEPYHHAALSNAPAPTPDPEPDPDPTPDPAPAPDPDNPFKDVKEGAFYYDSVLWAVEKGVTSGVSPTAFEPGATCTRGQVVTFLWRAKGSPEPESAENPFEDVKEGAFYYKAVLWAVEKGITAGTSEKTFSPDDPCTRGQVVTFLWRTMGQPQPAGEKNPFRDVETEAFYYQAMLWAVGEGITTGTGKDTFSPADPCTRGQVVTFLYRTLN